MRDLTIVTLSRNPAYLSALFYALAEQGGELPSYIGLVVNNANTPEIAAVALEHNWASIDPRYNTSYSDGNNLGVSTIEKAAGPSEFILFLNDDAVPEPGWLAELWEQRTQADVVGCLLLSVDGKVNHAGGMINLRGDNDHIGRLEPRGNWDGFALTPWVTFAAALMNTEMFHKVGGFDRRYNYGCEDLDMCMKVLEAGGSVGCARDAVAMHDECGTRPRGGDAAQHNVAQFSQTWGSRLGDVLTEYVKRKHPEKVEGVWR